MDGSAARDPYVRLVAAVVGRPVVRGSAWVVVGKRAATEVLHAAEGGTAPHSGQQSGVARRSYPHAAHRPAAADRAARQARHAPAAATVALVAATGQSSLLKNQAHVRV